MRALLSAVGTRGDVQPALALALELRKLGHEARLCTSPNFVDQARALGLDARPMGVEMRMPAGKAGPPPVLTPEALQRLRASLPDLVADQFQTLEAAVDGCDVIVGCNAHQYAAPSVAEHAGIGCVTAAYAPVALPSSDLAPTPGSTGTIADQWAAVRRTWNERSLDRVNAQRARLGLRAIDDVLDYALTDHPWLACDPALGPAPILPGQTVFQTGSWVFGDRTPLPADVDHFLAQGDPPVFVGFGSMPAAPEVARTLIAAIRAAGRRVLLSRGWADLALAAADCFEVGDVSFDLLFPRMAAVIHHGGAGTTATAARAGIPQLITPLFGDQFYWASRVVALGIGATAAHAGLTEAAATAALRELLDPAASARAKALSTTIRSDGAAVAARRLADDYGGRAPR